MLHHFAKYQENLVKLNKVVKKYVPNKQTKFDVKMFLH